MGLPTDEDVERLKVYEAGKKAGAAAERERLAKLAEDKAHAARSCGLFQKQEAWHMCADFIRRHGEEE